MNEITIFLLAGMILGCLAICEYLRFARLRNAIERILVKNVKSIHTHGSVELVDRLFFWKMIQCWDQSLKKCYYVFRPMEWLFVLVGISFVMCLISRWVFAHSWIASGIISGLLVSLIHKGWLWWGNTRYQSLIRLQIPELCRFMSYQLQAGKSMDEAIGTVVDHLDSPLKEELQICRDQLKTGVHIEQVLNQWEKRVEQPDLSFLTRVLILHKQTGLDLILFMKRMSIVMEERYRKKELQSSMTQAKYIAAFALPILFIVIVALSSNRFGYEGWFEYDSSFSRFADFWFLDDLSY